MVFTLAGCKENNQESLKSQTYEYVLSELLSQKGNDELLELISFEKESFNIEPENEIEQRMDFRFLIKNLTDDRMKIGYVAYFPKELDPYYLSRTSMELEEVELKPGQILDTSQSVLVQYEEKLTAKQNQFLKNNGHVMYFAISVNGKLHYVKVKLDEVGFINSQI